MTAAPQTLASLVHQLTGTLPLDCYQCGRCAAGCPQNVPGEMDISPTRVMHLLQLEAAFPEKAVEYARQAMMAETPWLCAGCLACTTRCPQGVDIAGAMDVLRQEGLRRGISARTKRVRDIQALHRVFLRHVLRRGRIQEFYLVLAYKMRTGQFFQDARLGPAMFARGKLHILPAKSPGARRVKAALEQLRKK